MAIHSTITMIRFLTLILLALLMQSGVTQTCVTNIPVQSPGELGYGATFSQDLGVTPAALQAVPGGSIDGTYMLKFSVENTFTGYPGYYTVELSFGTQELCETSGWGTRNFTPVTLVCPGPAYIALAKSLPGGGPVQGYSNLHVKWTVNDGSSNGGWPVKFDNKVSLTFAPQPY